MKDWRAVRLAMRSCSTVWCRIVLAFYVLRFSPTGRLLSVFVLSSITVSFFFDLFIQAGIMRERTLILILLWSLFVSLIGLAAGDFAAWWMIRKSMNRDTLGYILQQQYLSLTIRHCVMVGFHFVLAYVITYGHYPIDQGSRISLFTTVLVAAVVACWYSVRMARWAHRHRRDF